LIVGELTVFLETEIPKIGFEHIDVPTFILATPILQTWLRELKCPPLQVVASIVFPPGGDQKIHTDTQKNNLALNFGVQVKDSRTAMHKILSGTPIEQPYGNQGYTFIDYSNCTFKKVTEFVLDRDPVLFNVHQLHNVINQTPNTRVAISLRFTKDPVHLI
jgi:hypothetical protein